MAIYEKDGATYKKTLFHPKADESDRLAHQQKIQQYEKQDKSVVFIDERGFSHDTPRTHGYSPKGHRCFGFKNWGAKGRTNVIGALLGGTLFAIGLFDCNIDRNVFHAWVTKVLRSQPSLKIRLLLWTTPVFKKARILNRQL